MSVHDYLIYHGEFDWAQLLLNWERFLPGA
jgi:hypothetical protein